MRKPAALILGAALILAPVTAQAWRGHAHYRHAYHPHRHHNSDVVFGVLGGIVGGILVDRVLWPPAPVIAYPPRVITYPPRYPRVYRRGYRDGYDHGYDDGYRNGYDDMYCRTYGTCRY